LVVLLAAMRHPVLPGESSLRRLASSAGLLGWLVGSYALFYETATVLAFAATGVVGLHAARTGARRFAAALAALFAGAAVGFAPLPARNAAIGAPLWTGSSRLGLNLALCNRPGAFDGGATFTVPDAEFKQIMEASGGATWEIVRQVWLRYDDKSRLFRNWAHRFGVVWASVEMPDNTSFGFYRRHSSVLRASRSFRWMFPAAAALWVAWLAEQLARRPRGDAPAGPPSFGLSSWFAERGGAHATLIAFTLPLALAMTVVPPQARYRLFLVPAFIVYTSLAGLTAARLLAARRVAPAAGLAGVVVVFAALQLWLSEPRERADDRFVDYSVAGSIYRRRGNEAAAAEYFRRRVIGGASDRTRGPVPDE